MGKIENNKNAWMARVVEPMSKKRLVLPEETWEGRVKLAKESFRNLIHTILTGNIHGMPRKCTDERRRFAFLCILAGLIAASAGAVAIKAAYDKYEIRRHERFLKPTDTTLTPDQMEALYTDETPLKLMRHYAAETDDPKSVLVHREYTDPAGRQILTVKKENREDYDNNQELFREVERGSYQDRRYPFGKIAKDIAGNHGSITIYVFNGSFKEVSGSVKWTPVSIPAPVQKNQNAR